MKNIDVSIIVACYNGAGILEDGINKIKEIMDKTRYNYEFVIVDDKSKDNSVEIAENIKQKHNNVKLILHEKNMGRGITVSDGIITSSGRIVGFTDIDLETPAHYIIPLIMNIEKGADIATAKRIYKLNFKEYYILTRYITHKGYKFLVKLFFQIPIMDTETGCKFFNKNKILPVLDQIKDHHWFWDTEIMIRSYYAGLKIREVPSLFIKRTDNPSTLKLWKDSKDYFIKLLQFRKEIKNFRK